MKTILDISNTLLSSSNLITKDISDYFQENTFNFSDQNINTQIEELLENFYNVETHNTIFVAYQLFLQDSAFETTIINKLFSLFDIENKESEIEQYTQSLFDILIDNETKIKNLNINFYPENLEKTIFNSYKFLTVRENIGEIYNNSLITKFEEVGNILHYSEYLYYLNLNINLNFSGFDFSNKTLYDYTFFNTNFQNCDFTNCDISNTIMNSCDFFGCIFNETDFYGVDLKNSNFQDVDLSSVTLNSVNATLINEVFTQNKLPISHRYDSSFKMIIKNTENLDKKGLAASKAADSGVSGTTIETINGLSNLTNGPISSNIQEIVLNQLTNSTSEDNKRDRRHSLTRLLLFKSTANSKRIFIDANNLLMPDVFLKDRVAILEPNIEINVNNYLDEDGFYLPLEDDEYVIITLLFSDLKVMINRYGTFNNKGRYSITKISGASNMTVNENDSLDYLNRQYFIDGETCRINELDLFFGGVGEAELPLVSSGFGDPYLFPIYGKPTKLPDLSRYYRMVEGRQLYINSYVNKLSEEMVIKMEQWFENKTGFKSRKFGFVSSGYFFTDHWVFCDGHCIHLDLKNNLINVKENALTFFNIYQDYNYYVETENLIKGEKYRKFLLNFNSENHGNINITLKFYLNPQIENGIQLSIEKNKLSCKGLLIHNFKPNLMRLDNLTKKKDPKLKRRLKKAKNKFSVRELFSKKELYI